MKCSFLCFLTSLVSFSSLSSLCCFAAPAPGQSTLSAEEEAQPNGPIPIRFTLQKPGYVTLVINDAEGKRVRNLLAETRFDAGSHKIYWDGLSEGTRVLVPRTPGINKIERSLVPAGSYRVTGLVRDALDLRYEFTAYPSGLKNVPWPTDLRKGTGGWLADHSAPAAAVYLPSSVTTTGKPQVLLASGTAESSFGLAWVNEDGVKERGLWRLGGQWTGANFLARDRSPNANKSIQAYAGTGWNNDKQKSQGEIRINVLTKTGDATIFNYPISAERTTGRKKVAVAELNGLAVFDGLVVASLGDTNELLFVDALGAPDAKRNLARRRTPDSPTLGKVLGTVSLPDAGGLDFDGQGRLYVLVNNELHRHTIDRSATPPKLSAPEILVKTGLDNPQRVFVADDGEIYVSNWGSSHQIKVFSSDGKPLSAIGKPGEPVAGKYDVEHLTNPSGIALTDSGQLWVTERNKIPKRISVWTRQGKLLNAIYGPPKYGGGGSLDSCDATRFYYAEKEAAMELRLDWKTGQSTPVGIYWRPAPGEPDLPQGWTGPQNAIHVGNRQYMTNTYNSSPTRGAGVGGLWIMRDGVAKAAAFVGDPSAWPLLATKEFLPAVPAELGLDREVRSRRSGGLFAWSDRNADGKVQPTEFTFLMHDRTDSLASVAFHDDLTISIVRKSGVWRLAPSSIDASGVPIYDAKSAKFVTKMIDWVPASGGGGEALLSGDQLVVTGGPIQGFSNGKAQWIYHNQWPGLQAGHQAPRLPEYSGQLLATTRVLGAPVSVGTEKYWAINSDKGVIYLFTTDGLLVATLGKYPTEAPPWRFDEATRNMAVNDVNFIGEHFWPTLNQAPDGKIYLVIGKEHSSLVRLDGLESARRLAPIELQVSPELVQKARAFAQTRVLQDSEDKAPLTVALRQTAPKIDGALDDWQGATWATIDAQSRAAVAVAGDQLFVAVHSDHLDLLQNDGEDLTTLFKSGGAIDVQLRTRASNGQQPDVMEGDVRLLVTKATEKTVVAAYRPVVPGTKNPVPYASPQRTITIDRVDDASASVQLAQANIRTQNRWGRTLVSRAYEFSIPLRVLGLQPQEGMQISGDIGILLGKNNETVARSYWHNKASGIVSDVPSEAELKPNLWGQWIFTAKTPTPVESGAKP